MEYSLKERVILIAGPLSSTVQNLMSGLTAEGADVALLDEEANKADKFCSQLTDQREVKPKHGRATAIKTNLTKFEDIKDAVGKVAQSFGGIDILIDAQLWNEPSEFQLDSNDFAFDNLIEKNLKSSLLLTQAVAGFLKGRKKGRIIYFIYDSILKANPADVIQSAIRSGIVNFAQGFSKQVLQHNVTVNVISLGLTEEYLLSHDPQKSIKEALEKQKSLDPTSKITEPEKITNTLIFLLGPSGAAITGQLIRLT